jgi:glycerol kinase
VGDPELTTRHILAIDQGTSGTKAVVVDLGDGGVGRIAAIAEVGLRPRYLAGGGVEQDPDALFDSVVTAGRRALAQAGVPVAAVALANQGETVLAWDRHTGRPLTPAIVWQDRRAEALCAALSGHAEELARRTGLVCDPYFSAPKMAWIRTNLTRAGVVTTTDTWSIWTPWRGTPSWWSCSASAASRCPTSSAATRSWAAQTSSGRRFRWPG